MRISANIMILGVVALITGCSGDDPADPGNGQPDDDFVLVSAATVGAAGGTLESAEFLLTVPAGAFATDQELELYSSTEQPPFGEDAASKIFRIDGIPDDYSSPLRLAVRYQDKLVDESCVAWGEEVRVPNSGELVIAYHLVAAQDSLGFLVGMIPAPDPTDKAGSSAPGYPSGRSGQSLRAAGVTGVIYESPPDPHFRILHLGLSEPSTASEALLANLNEAVEFLGRLHFDLTIYRQYPVDVIIRGLPGDASSRFLPSGWSHQNSRLEFDTGAIFDLERNRIDAYHEMALLMFSFFDPRNRLVRSLGPDPEWLWFNEAAATYFEYIRFDSMYNFSSKRHPNEFAPFNGFHAGALLTSPRSHGYGMSAFLRHNRDGVWNGKLHHAMARIRDGRHVALAITDVFGSPQVFLPNFFHQYISQNVYSDFYTGRVLNQMNPQYVFAVRSAADDDTTFTPEFPDLSARVFDVRLQDPAMDPGAEITVTVRGRTAPIIVYTYREEGGDLLTFDLEQVAESANEVTIRGVKDYNDQGKSLLVFVTNTRAVYPFTDMTPLDVTIQVSQPLPYTRCYFKFDVMGQYRLESGGNVTYEDQRVILTSTGEGWFEGNTFIGFWERVDEYVQMRWEGSLTAMVNAARDSLLSFYATETTFLEGSLSSEYSFVGSNIPLDLESPGDLGFQEYQEEVCDHIDELTYEWLLQFPDESKVLVDRECRSSSEFKVYFYTGK